MTINSATDHGYNTDWSIQVAPGLTFRHLSAEGISEHRVLRRLAPYRGPYWEVSQLTGIRAPQIEIWSASDILEAVYAPTREAA